jgi:hypothetical protein
MTCPSKTWVRDDGGRKAAGFKGTAGDCVVRAIAIATRKPYREVHDAMAAAHATYADGGEHAIVAARAAKQIANETAGERGVYDRIWQPFLREQGWKQTRTIGADGAVPTWGTVDFPPGRLVVELYGHLVAVVDGIARDTHDCVRSGRVRVYGYWQAAGIADRINAAHVECEKSLRASVEHAIRAGELLLEAKRTVGHGEWIKWLAENVKFSDRLAQAYMRLARLPVEKRNAVADLPLREALSAIRNREKRLADAEERENRPPPVRAIVVIGSGADREWPPTAPPTPDEIADDLIRQLVEAATSEGLTDRHLWEAFERRFGRR